MNATDHDLKWNKTKPINCLTDSPMEMTTLKVFYFPSGQLWVLCVWALRASKGSNNITEDIPETAKLSVGVQGAGSL